MSYFDNDDDFMWTSSTIPSGNFTLLGGTNSLAFTVSWPQEYPIIPDKDWMPYRHFEYDPIFHKKYARYKIQMEKMWD